MGRPEGSPNEPEEPPAFYRCRHCRGMRQFGNGDPEFYRPVFLRCEGTCGELGTATVTAHVFVVAA